MTATIFEAGNVAVVTGAALGIGRAACQRFAKQGMSVCLADLPGEDLAAAAQSVADIAPRGHEQVLACQTDVSDPDQVENLRHAVLDRFGKVDVLMNNAVTRIGRGHPVDVAAWRKAMDINYWGIVYGVETFLPGMLASASPCRIVNVGSKQGITNPPGNTIYNITKSAVKTYTEALQHDLRSNAASQHISAHLLIPGWTTTGKNEHKPGAWRPEQVVDLMLERIEAEAFYILCPDDEVPVEMDHRRIRWAADDIVENRPPLSRWHPDFKDAAAKACN